jgi:hypothetical protein
MIWKVKRGCAEPKYSLVKPCTKSPRKLPCAGKANKHSAASRGHNGAGLEGQRRMGTAKSSNGAKRAEISTRDVGCAGQGVQLLVGHGSQKMKEFSIKEFVVVFSIVGAKLEAHVPVYQSARQVLVPTRFVVVA